MSEPSAVQIRMEGVPISAPSKVRIGESSRTKIGKKVQEQGKTKVARAIGCKRGWIFSVLEGSMTSNIHAVGKLVRHLRINPANVEVEAERRGVAETSETSLKEVLDEIQERASQRSPSLTGRVRVRRNVRIGKLYAFTDEVRTQIERKAQEEVRTHKGGWAGITRDLQISDHCGRSLIKGKGVADPTPLYRLLVHYNIPLAGTKVVYDGEVIDLPDPREVTSLSRDMRGYKLEPIAHAELTLTLEHDGREDTAIAKEYGVSADLVRTLRQGGATTDPLDAVKFLTKFGIHADVITFSHGDETGISVSSVRERLVGVDLSGVNLYPEQPTQPPEPVVIPSEVRPPLGTEISSAMEKILEGANTLVRAIRVKDDTISAQRDAIERWRNKARSIPDPTYQAFLSLRKEDREVIQQLISSLVNRG